MSWLWAQRGSFLGIKWVSAWDARGLVPMMQGDHGFASEPVGLWKWSLRTIGL